MSTNSEPTVDDLHRARGRFLDALEEMAGPEKLLYMRLDEAWLHSLSLLQLSQVPANLRERAEWLDATMRRVSLRGRPGIKFPSYKEQCKAAYELFHLYEELTGELIRAEREEARSSRRAS